MIVIGGGRVVTPTELIEYGWVRIRGGHIAEIGVGAYPDRLDVDLAGRTLVPGFIDQHCHGGGRNAFTTTDGAEAFRAAQLHLAHGTTSIMASLVTASHDDLVAQIRTLSPLVDQDVLFGIHLEGPWISPVYPGAHDQQLLRHPTRHEVGQLLAQAGGRIRMVTLAPELPNAIAAIHQIVRSGAVAAIGHTNADYEQTRAAIDAGARVGTHLTNAMRPMRHRDPGPAAALLEDPRVNIEAICDGLHVHSSILRLLFDEAGVDRISMITDAMAAAGAGDGHFMLGPLAVEVADGVAHVAGTEIIAGSTLTLDMAMRYLVLNSKIGLPAATHALSTTPARAMGLTDRGEITVGKRADLLVLGADLQVDRVMVRGDWIESVEL